MCAQAGSALVVLAAHVSVCTRECVCVCLRSRESVRACECVFVSEGLWRTFVSLCVGVFVCVSGVVGVGSL